MYEKKLFGYQEFEKERLNLTEEYLAEVKSQLPNKKYYEFMNHCFFENITDIKGKWAEYEPWDQWDYPNTDVNRFNELMLRNKKYIKGKAFMDWPAHTGAMALVAHGMGAKSVTGVDIYDHKVNIMKESFEAFGWGNATAMKQDWHDYPGIVKTLEGIDTLLMAGIMNHFADHYEILKAISMSDVKTLIIDQWTGHHKDIYEETPHIYWMKEPLHADVNHGYEATSLNQKEHIVGLPNPAFLDLILDNFGWKLEDSYSYQMLITSLKEKHETYKDKNMQHERFVLIFTRE